jgi:hypothetical protein
LASEVTNLSGYQTKASNQFAHRNLVINGDMQVAQRGTSTASITSGGYYTADRFGSFISSLGTWTQSVENDAPTGSGFRKSLKMLCTTADASPAAGDVAHMQQAIEGQNLQHIKKGTAAAEQLTLSFWVKANVTGTYVAELYDNDNTRQTSKSYTISASGVWEYKTITFAADTTGAFDNDNNNSFSVIWWLGAGSTYTSGTLQSSWGSITNANRAAGQVNLAAATNNYWQITGVQLEVGDTATPFEFLPVQEELAQCQRYFYLHASGADEFIALGTYMTNTDVFAGIHFPVTMRVAPTAVSSAGSNYFRFWTNGLNDDFDSIGIQVAARSGAGISQATGTISGTAYRSGFVRTNNALASIAFNSEL